MGKHSLNFGSVHRALLKRFAPVRVVKRDGCTAATFYQKPAQGAIVSMNENLDIEWDNSCIGQPATVDISLIAANLTTENALIHQWTAVDFGAGAYSAALDPSWLPKNASLTYQLSIVASGSTDTPAIYQTAPSLPLGPFFKGTFNQTLANLTPLSGNSPDKVTVVNNAPPKGLSKGSIAAAVIMPILVVAFGIAGYVWWSRKKEAARRKEYRENLDQRMSIAPGADWAPISAAGAAAAIRHSMAMSATGGDRNTRASSFFGRQSTYQADPPQEMRQTSRSRNASTEQTRVSRVSFAETTYARATDRPAVPPLPQAYRKSAYGGGDHEASPDVLSPTQREGAVALDEDSIRDRLSGTGANNRNSGGDFDHDADTLPALTMMRANEGSLVPQQPAPVLTRETMTGDYRTFSIGAYSGNSDSIVTDTNSNAPSYFNPPSTHSDPDEALRSYASRNPQMLPVTTTASPFSGFAAGPALVAAAGFDMSPDAIFRAYAATRPAAPPAVVDPQTPGVMRNLYNPTMTQGLGLRPRADTTGSSIVNNNPYRESMAPGPDDYDIGKAH